MIDGRDVAALRPDDLDAVAELLANVVIELASIDDRLARLEAHAGGTDGGDVAAVRSDVGALLGRLLPRR